jgi:acetyl esterase/lipase
MPRPPIQGASAVHVRLAAAAFLTALLVTGIPATAQPLPPGAAIPIWTGGAPGSQARRDEPERLEGSYVHNIHSPSLTPFPADPAHATGAAMIVVPGGGHRMLVVENEGYAPARILNRFGLTAFVLRYRLAREPGSPYTIEGDAAADLRRAIRWVRSHAADYALDPGRIGVMGFSAGGELVSLVADNPAVETRPTDPVDRVSARPDFQLLVYPGPLGIPARAAALAPPALIVAGSLDACCAEPAMTLYAQLREAKVSAELHLYADADHGFNLGIRSQRLSISHWPDRIFDWLSDGGWLQPRSPAAAARGKQLERRRLWRMRWSLEDAT